MDLEKEKLRLELFATQREALRANQQIMQFQIQQLDSEIEKLGKALEDNKEK